MAGVMGGVAAGEGSVNLVSSMCSRSRMVAVVVVAAEGHMIAQKPGYQQPSAG